MTRLVWDQQNERRYESGISNGVFYPASDPGVAWNGLISVEETTVGTESPDPLYLEGTKYFDNKVGADFEATIEAFSAPAEFGPSDGEYVYTPGFILTRQPRLQFGLSYKTFINTDEHYKIHLIYNALAIPDQRGRKTNSNNVEVSTFKWKITTVPPVIVSAVRPSAHIVVDSRLVDPADLATLENNLYGTVGTNPTLPSFDDVYTVLGWV
jgi:hypothetical protein